MCPSTDEIIITALLSYSGITAKSIELENVSLIDTPNLGTAFNTLAADERYPVLIRDNLKIPIQMQILQKKKTFFNFFGAFLISRLNFEHFGKKDEPHRCCISEIKDSENLVR